MAGRKVWGIIFIIIGVFFLLTQLLDSVNFPGIGKIQFWPLIVLAAGVIFEAAHYSTRRAAGLLVPGGILTVTGLLFLFESVTSFRYAAYTWPVYVLSVSAGLYQLYLARRSRGVRLAARIIGFVGAVMLAVTVSLALIPGLDAIVVLAVLFIAAGAALLWKAWFRKRPSGDGDKA